MISATTNKEDKWLKEKEWVELYQEVARITLGLTGHKTKNTNNNHSKLALISSISLRFNKT